MSEQHKKRQHRVRSVLVIPYLLSDCVGWKVRMVASWLPFYLDSNTVYLNKEQAEKVAARWRKMGVTVNVSAKAERGK